MCGAIIGMASRKDKGNNLCIHCYYPAMTTGIPRRFTQSSSLNLY
jgi:hypothetical protein